ncbi:anti-sigma factor [Brevibacillus sp. TJ4]|uniref:anti-sigma factor n=1 Tax=Brevibacillus sp. TJ4 TaxID=3234853 RepID=UPI0037D53377
MTNRENEDREKRMLAYLRGELPADEEERLREELLRDEEYAERMERLLLGEEEGVRPTTEEVRLPEERQQLLLRRGKWRMRFGNAGFTLGIAFFAGVVIWFANVLFGYPIYDDMHRVVKSVFNFTQPGVSVGSSGSQIGLFYGNIRMELRESVGNSQRNAGYLESKNVLWNVQVQPKWTNGARDMKLFFRYPTEASAGEETDYLRSSAWKTMDTLPEGTVSQLAISFDRFLTYQQYQQLISRHLGADEHQSIWFAVDTGQEAKDHDESAGNVLLSAGDVWGFAERELHYGDKPILENGEGERREQAFLDEMKFLVEKKSMATSIARQLMYNEPAIEERYEYVRENGLRIYGAVITGPTKELLALREEPSITAAMLGEVDWWNWDMPPASGRQYSR